MRRGSSGAPPEEPAAGADIATDYARGVVDGRVPAGELVVLACRRHLRMLEEGNYSWDLDAVERWVYFAARCCHQKGPFAGQPIVLEPWQVFASGAMLGWKRPDGLRLYRDGYVEIPRKQGKTLIYALLAFYLTFFSGEPGAEGYFLAPGLKQAKTPYGVCEALVKADPWLRRKNGHGTIDLWGGDGPRTVPRMVCSATGAFLEPVDASQDTKDGFNPSVILVDEYHEHPSDALVEKYKTGTGARAEPLTVKITTAGDDLTSACYREHQRAERMLRGQIEEPELFAYIAHRNAEVDWRAELAIRQACPNIGVSVPLEFVRGELLVAQNDASKENWKRRMYLNDWMQQQTRWLQLHVWDACLPPLDEALDGQVCFGAYDLSKSRDLSAFVLLFPHPDATYSVRLWLWVTQEAVERRKRDKRAQTYDLWIKQGYIQLCEGNTIDTIAVERTIIEAADTYDLRLVGYDASWGGGVIAQRLQDLAGIEVVAIRQRIEHMAEPTGLFEDLVKRGALRHGGHPVLRWMAEHASVKTDTAGNRMVIKPRTHGGQGKAADDEGKVDGIVAAVMALRAAALTEEGQRAQSADTTDGVKVIDLGGLL